MKKLTYEFVKESFEKEGYTLVSTEYIRSDSKLEYICDKGHLHSIVWNAWNQGVRCGYCNGTIKPTIEEVNKSFSDEGYTLLSTEYIHNKIPLEFICNNGHKHSITWMGWVRGQRCFYCVGNVPPVYDFIYDSFKKEGYTLLSTEYVNNRTKLEYICPNGHQYSISWTSWQSGGRCRICAGNILTSYEEVSKLFSDEGYTLLSSLYNGCETKLECVCPNKHVFITTKHNWGSGCRCPICANINKMGPGNSNWLGGLTLEQYCEAWKDKEYKQDIRDRDQNRCLNPYCQSNNPNDLSIHHIDYDKKNCKPDNLITVCRSCNSKANVDRDWHQSWYRAILRNRYGYTY